MQLRTGILFVSLIFFAVFAWTVSADVAAPYEVGPWGNFCKGAVSFTFDDNCPNQLSVAQPLFDAKGFHMTYFVAVNWKHDWSKYRAAFNKGHEIGSHSLNHNTPMKLLARRVSSAGGDDITMQIGNITAASLIYKIDGNGISWSGMVVPEMKILVTH